MIHFSIVIPVYNAEQYLGDCLESVLNQSYSDYEIILVNDGSTDNSKLLCEQFALEHQTVVRLINQENKGQLTARRMGILAANGEYIVSLDSDDKLRCDALGRISENIESTSADVVCFDYSRCEDFSTQDSASLFSETTVFENKAEYLKCLCSSSKLNNLATKVIKRDLFAFDNDSDSCSIKMGDDLFLAIDVLNNANTVSYIKECLYYYRTNLGSTTRKFASGNLKDLRIVRGKLRDYAKEWSGKYPGFDYVEAVDGVSLQSCCELAQNACMDLEYDAAITFLETLVEDELFLQGMHCNNVSRYCRADYLVVYRCLLKERFSLVWLLFHGKAVIKSLREKRKRESLFDNPNENES